jgi:hypothetical protein
VICMIILRCEAYWIDLRRLCIVHLKFPERLERSGLGPVSHFQSRTGAGKGMVDSGEVTSGT